jgi:DNA-binding transcriptional ArsR family regulator
MSLNMETPSRDASPIATAETEVSSGETALSLPYISGMTGSSPSIAEVAALIGNPARANILTVLLDGRALTATELADIGGVSPQTASGHLGKLTETGLLAVHKQGRHSYFRLASPLIGRTLEGIMAVAAQGPPRYRPRWRGDEALRTARTCYDHLAGRLGVALADALAEREHVVLGEDGGVVTASGEAFRRFRHRRAPDRQRQTGVLPSVSRLERTPPASRRCGRRRTGEAHL